MTTDYARKIPRWYDNPLIVFGGLALSLAIGVYLGLVGYTVTAYVYAKYTVNKAAAEIMKDMPHLK